MGVGTNLTTVDTSADLTTDASKFFNNYYQPIYTVKSDVDTAVLAFFEKIAENRDAARIMASAVIYTSLAQRVDPMVVLDKFRSMNREELIAYTNTFLNLNRVGTSYLGIRNQPRAGRYVARSILA